MRPGVLRFADWLRWKRCATAGGIWREVHCLRGVGGEWLWIKTLIAAWLRLSIQEDSDDYRSRTSSRTWPARLQLDLGLDCCCSFCCRRLFLLGPLGCGQLGQPAGAG